MAERRMFAKTITESDAFRDMPLSTQALYFHLGMDADDDGVVNKPKGVQRCIGASDDDLKLLIAKKFIVPFESGIVVIKHWKMNNYIRPDRYKPSAYQEELSMLEAKENGSYTLGIPNGNQPVYQMDTQDRKGKISLDKASLVKSSIDEDNNELRCCHDPVTIYKALFDREPIPKEISFVNFLIERFGYELLIEAVNTAILNNKFSLGYVQGILNNWKDEGIETYDDYIEYDLRKSGILEG